MFGFKLLEVQTKRWTSPLSATKRQLALTVARNVTDAIGGGLLLEGSCCITTKSFAGFDPLPLAVLFSVADEVFPNAGYRSMSHNLLKAGTQHGFVRGRVSLFGGLAQLGVSADYLARKSHYKQLLAWTDETVVALSKGMTESMARAVSTDALRFSDYDLISGISGALRYLLLRREHLAKEDIEYVLNGLCKPIDRSGVLSFGVKSENIEGYLAARVQKSERLINCGFAHGVPGVLAMLSLAWKSGFDSRSVRSAVQKLTDYLTEFVADDEHGIGWPDARIYPEGTSPKIAMDAWCYGNAGIARAIWLSSIASKKKSDASVARSAIHAAIRRELSFQRLKTPWVCHGLAGLLLVLLRFYNDSADDLVGDGIDQITDRLLAQYEEDNLLGFADPAERGSPTNDVSLLNGAAGVALVLYSAATDLEPGWDALLGLS